jgi:hypothetical protein
MYVYEECQRLGTGWYAIVVYCYLLRFHSILLTIKEGCALGNYLFIKKTWNNTKMYFPILVLVICQGSENTPPVLMLDRTWSIPSNEVVGSIVTRVRAIDAENDPLIFGLEPKEGPLWSGEPVPFTINNSTGVVYLNESLKDKVTHCRVTRAFAMKTFF